MVRADCVGCGSNKILCKNLKKIIIQCKKIKVGEEAFWRNVYKNNKDLSKEDEIGYRSKKQYDLLVREKLLCLCLWRLERE